MRDDWRTRCRGVGLAHNTADTSRVLRGAERRTLHLSAGTDTVRRVIRARLREPFADGLGVYMGRTLKPGVMGCSVGDRLWLAPVPPGRTLIGSRNAPQAVGKIVPSADDGADVRLFVFTRGFPYRTVEDPIAMAFFDEWLATLARELGAQSDGL